MLAHDLIRKPVPIPDQVEDMLFWIIRRRYCGAARLTIWSAPSPARQHSMEPAWQAEFEKYKEIPQYRELNRGMQLAQFKVIYYWEWSHRVLARLTGAVFLLPFLFFLWRGYIPPGLRLRLWTIFTGGALLGVVGWWMVSSGLAGSTLVKVSQYRLAFHMTFACLIYAGVLWTAQQLAPRRPSDTPKLLRFGALALAALLLVQIYLGALVAGLDAGLKYNTWPTIDGEWIPALDRMLFISPPWRNLFENDLVVQINHRMLADGIWALALLQVYGAWRLRGELDGAVMLAVLVTLQAALGIVTLLYEAPLALSLSHQVAAIVVFTYSVVYAERLLHHALPAPRITAVTA
ncbi:MAG: COX15/CtaA family protein [Rhizobiales bacterium]|nr:COX15/CtaA family protein [Hyphomicrobiales bacterium]